MTDRVVSLDDMTRAAAIDATLEHLLAGDPSVGDPLSEDISLMVLQINELFPAAVIPTAIADAHIAQITATAGSLEPVPATQAIAVARYGLGTRITNFFSPLARKGGVLVLSLSVAFSAMAYAGVLPDPFQRTAADLGRIVGIDLPDPDSAAADGSAGSVGGTNDLGHDLLLPKEDGLNGGQLDKDTADQDGPRSEEGSSLSDGGGGKQSDDPAGADDSEAPEASSDDTDEGSRSRTDQDSDPDSDSDPDHDSDSDSDSDSDQESDDSSGGGAGDSESGGDSVIVPGSGDSDPDVNAGTSESDSDPVGSEIDPEL